MQIPRTIFSFLSDLRNVFRSEYFLDALRITLSIIVPFAAFYYYTNPHTAITIGVGALLISLTDSPGTFKDKLTMSISSLCIFFIVSLIASILIKSVILTGLLILSLCVIFSLFTVFGKRYVLLGTMALILMTFVQGLKPENPLSFSIYIVIGGICYYVISLVQIRLWPLSSVKHAMGECIISTSDFLRAKANFYRADSDLQDNYLKIIRLHNKVSEKQEQVRDLLLRNKQLMKDDHFQGKRHLVVLTQVIDLYELISAIQYDYEYLQKSLKGTGLLESITKVIEYLSSDLNRIGTALSAKLKIKTSDSAWDEIEIVKLKINKIIASNDKGYASILLKLQENINDIYVSIKQISATLVDKKGDLEFPADLPAYQLFASDESLKISAVKNHLNFKSPIFRFALRLSFACIVSYSLMFLPVGFYSYWILLTVIVVIKPSFGLTKKRNIQRLTGSLTGVLIGVLILMAINNTAAQLILAALFLLGYFVYLRLNYTLSIMSLTPMVIICLNIYTGNSSVILERVLDTIAGCAIAFATAYLFPSWEIKKHAMYIGDVIKANLRYLKKLHDQSAGIPSDITSFKLARKDVYTRLAILSSGVQNMLLEPKKAQSEIQQLYSFEILSHQLSSTIASFFPFSNSNGHLSEIRDKISQAMGILEMSISILEDSAVELSSPINIALLEVLDVSHPDHVEQHKIQQILLISEAVKDQVYQYKFGKTK